MKRITITSLAAAVLVAFASASLAGAATDTPRVDRREARQHARIHQGARSGALTRHEARLLHRDQRRIHRMERRVKADGVVTGRERARLNRVQDYESRKIYRLKHNSRTRWGR